MRGKGKGSFRHERFKPVYSIHILKTLVFFLGTSTGLATHSVWNTSLMNLAFRNFASSLAMAFLFTSPKRLFHRFGPRVDVEVVLGKFLRHSLHVGGFPCKDINVIA